MNGYVEALKNYAVLSGRAKRREYWTFTLCNLVCYLSILGTTGPLATLVNIYLLAAFVPSIAVGVRRMHDTNHSGWWILFPVVNFVIAFTESSPGRNRFGAEPSAASAAQCNTSKNDVAVRKIMPAPGISSPALSMVRSRRSYLLLMGPEEALFSRAVGVMVNSQRTYVGGR